MTSPQLILLDCFARTHQIAQCLGALSGSESFQASHLTIRLCNRDGDRLGMDIQTQKS
jgi:hypothetical protein